MMSSMPGNRKKQKSFYITLLISNLLVLIFGVLYLSIGSESMIWNTYGLAMLVVFSGNIFAAYFEDSRNARGYIYIAFSGISMLVVPILNSLVSFTETHYNSRSIVSSALVIALFISGALMAFSKLICRKTEAELLIDSITLKNMKESSRIKTVKTIIIVFLSIILAAGILVAYNFLVISNILWETEVFISGTALFYAFLFFCVGLLIIKLLPLKKYMLAKILYFLITLIISASCMLPFLSTPFLIRNADIEYTRAFGEEYSVSPDYNNDHFRKIKFSISDYIFGIITENFDIRKDIPFYHGTEGVDNGLSLYFDAYTPKADGDLLPGGNSVLVRIHGGGWTTGDKGFLNNAQISKYFASQGYAVFDIQYGLSNKNSLDKITESPYGDFTIDDMVRHISKFLKYLSENSKEYNANTDSVFISGGSAGGNLALASSLAFFSDKYKDLSDLKIDIRGLIPYYPANELAKNYGIGYSLEFNNPGLLVNEFSPPCLILQGTDDGLVRYHVTQQFKDNYTGAGNVQCAVIMMPFGGHACDMYFPGYYNQVFLYYMERFMYQFR